MIVVLAVVLRPNLCEGICFIDSSKQRLVNCTLFDPEVLYFHRLDFSFDFEFLEIVKTECRPRKGFNWMKEPLNKQLLLEYDIPGDRIKAIDRFHYSHRKILEKISWHLKFKSNHTFFTGFTKSIDWGDSSRKVRSITIIRDPRQRLKDSYESARGLMNDDQFEFHTKLPSTSTFEECVLNEHCRVMMGLHRFCSLQTENLCGPECFPPITETSLLLAKQNLRERFAFVGVAEESQATGSLLRRQFPTYFEYLPSNLHLPVTNHQFPTDVNQVLDDMCKFDDEVYREALKLLRETGKNCGVAL